MATIDPSLYFALIRNESGEYERFEEMKKKYKLVRGITTEIIFDLLKIFYENHYKMEAIKFWRAYFTVSNVPTLMNLFSDEHYKMEILKLFHIYFGTSCKDDVLSIIKLFSDLHYRLQALKCFKSRFVGQDVEEKIMPLFSDDHYRMEAIKLFALNFSRLDQCEVLRIISLFQDATDCIKFFDRWFKVKDLVLLCKAVASDPQRLQLVEKYNLKTEFNTAVSFVQLLDCFQNDSHRYRAFEKKMKDGIVVEKDMLNLTASFSNDKHRKKVVLALLDADVHNTIDADCCLAVMGTFSVPIKMTLLTVYLKHHSPSSDKLVALLKGLENKGNAVKLIKDNGFPSVGGENLLILAGYKSASLESTATPDNDWSDSDSESEPEPDLEDANDDDEDDGENIISLDGAIPQLHWVKLSYDVKRKMVIMNGRDFTFGSYILNGVDVEAEARRQAEKILKKRKERKQKAKERRIEAEKKKNQLKISHAIKDELATPATPEDCICIVCLGRVRKITLVPCGHYHTCAHCTRKTIRANPSKPVCPLCRQEFTQAIRVFA